MEGRGYPIERAQEQKIVFIVQLFLNDRFFFKS